MTFDDIKNFCCAKVGKTDNYTKERCADFILARHRTIYESFPWKTAQTIVTLTADGGGETSQDTLEVSNVSHVISVRVAGIMLDPVATSYVFESSKDDFNTPSELPKYYDVFYSATTQTPTIRFYPPLAITDDVAEYEVVILGKLPLDDAATHVAVPHTENALIAYVLGDLWEYLHQVGKAQAKFTEAQGLLQSAQTADTPAPMRPRLSVPLTATGNTLQELTDSVCNIIGKFDPDTRVSVKERIRRNYQLLADSALWPELTVLASVNITGDTVILPPHFDRIMAVRTNENADDLTHAPYQLAYRDAQLWFGLQPDIFESQGQRLSYSMLPPVAVNILPTDPEQLRLKLIEPAGDGGPLRPHPFPATPEKISVFIRGMLLGQEIHETVSVVSAGQNLPGPTPDSAGESVSANTYDEILTLTKPITSGLLTVRGWVSGTTFTELLPEEREKKQLRISLLPADDTLADEQRLSSVLVFGKVKITPMTDDMDSSQIRGVENILINSTAADMLFQMGQPDRATVLKSKSDQNMATLLSAETQQSAYEPRIMPYTETNSFCL